LNQFLPAGMLAIDPAGSFMNQTTQTLPRAQAIQRAATLVGGVGPLAQRLNVPETQLDYWMRDIGRPPDSVFFDVIGVIIDSAA
jgi:hypothetical protein